MVYVALLEGVALIATALSFTGIIRWQIRQHARERALLVEQVCHLSGRPWGIAPAEDRDLEREPDDAFGKALVTSPEQLPDF